ncbi:MAG: hypothetical protein U5L11_06755 [Arhodomonas sp.]|nr:hypothetical protein [Arhodomonas sp.]
MLEELGMDAVAEQVLSNTATLLERIAAEPGLAPVTPVEQARHAGIVAFTMGNADPSRLLHRLRGAGIPCAARAGGIRFSPTAITPPSSSIARWTAFWGSPTKADPQAAPSARPSCGAWE